MMDIHQLKKNMFRINQTFPFHSAAGKKKQKKKFSKHMNNSLQHDETMAAGETSVPMTNKNK